LALFNGEFGNDARLRREHARQTLLRHEPSGDARLARVVACKQQNQNGTHRQYREQREEAVRQARREQHRAQPLRLAFLYYLGAEQRLVDRSVQARDF